jgi:Fe2+ or Zn2+ uptake regulation protein
MTQEWSEELQLLRVHGLRATSQRIVILDAIRDGQGHSTLAAIYGRARRHDPGIDKSTVYRSLELFQKLGLVLSVELETHEKGYELVKAEPHHHFICKTCGREFDIDKQFVADFYAELEANYGYSVTMDHLVLSGTCPDCLKS